MATKSAYARCEWRGFQVEADVEYDPRDGISGADITCVYITLADNHTYMPTKMAEHLLGEFEDLREKILESACDD